MESINRFCVELDEIIEELEAFEAYETMVNDSERVTSEGVA
jgi:hypothetical protein